MNDIVIETRGMSRHFGDLKAVDQLDLSITKGSIYGFLGPNGCGKSTSIRMLTGLLSPTEGDIRVLGETLPKNADKLRQRIGYMTQKFSLYQDLSIEENLQFVGRIYNLSAKHLKRRIDELYSLYDLRERRKQFAGTLSGGQRQRLALAAATLHDPDLLFLDEPTSAVDPENRREFWERLFDLCGEGKTILVSTHYMDEAERCHGLAILENGAKRADGSPQELMAQMGVNVVEIEGGTVGAAARGASGGEDLRQLKSQLLQLPAVLSAAQLGTRLRVLVSSDIDAPRSYLQQLLPQQRSMELARPSLEDVFVSCTGGRRGIA
ncbi:MAG: ABC transporter ATP-binding protein [Cellvibrionaceae bacterium]|nr:ABC transporter ATP-binding protein [Cellvibrionaceae bacterium]|tara:strand:- start:27351 stop:28316 length:966 start_codon:yes stop_codon:yes gene_type:complete